MNEDPNQNPGSSDQPNLSEIDNTTNQQEYTGEDASQDLQQPAPLEAEGAENQQEQISTAQPQNIDGIKSFEQPQSQSSIETPKMDDSLVTQNSDLANETNHVAAVDSLDSPSQSSVVSPAASQPSVDRASPQPTTGKSRKPKTLIGVIITAIVLIVLALGTALVYNFWYQNPDKVVSDAIVHIMKAKSIGGEGEFVFESKDVIAKINFDSQTVGSDGRVNAAVVIEGASASQGQSLSFEAAASLALVGDSIYFKLDNVRQAVDNLAKAFSGADTMVESFNPIIERIDGQWISIKAADYKNVSQEVAKQQQCMTENLELLNSDQSVKQEIVDLYKNNKIVTIVNKLPAKSINGVGSLGYQVSINTKAMKSFVAAINNTKLGESLKKCSDIDFNEMADMIPTETTTTGAELTSELWVSRFGHNLTQYNMTSKATNDDSSAKLVFYPAFSDQATTIEAPSDAITIEQLQKDIEKLMVQPSLQSSY